MSEPKSNLDIALDWIYAHVASDEARSKLNHRLNPVVGAGPFQFAAYTGLSFYYVGSGELQVRAEELMATPEHAHWVLRDINTRLGVPIIPEYFQFPGVAPEEVDPIGGPWPEKSAELGREVYHVGQRAIAQIFDGMPWTAKEVAKLHPAGLYYAQSGSSWFGLKTIWMWVKQDA